MFKKKKSVKQKLFGLPAYVFSSCAIEMRDGCSNATSPQRAEIWGQDLAKHGLQLKIKYLGPVYFSISS